MAEVWKDIPGYEGRYQASTDGHFKGQVLSTCLGSNGCPYVGLRKTQDAANATFCPVPHLVALTFLGPRPDGMVICHADADKNNNRLENLRYDTPTENQIDVYRQGGRYGKLTVEQARDVKRRLERGESKNSIAKLYGISRTAVRYIAKGEHFGWLNT